MLGLNEYEARAYRALLAEDAVTAYELGKASGIPLSRCYEVARALAAKGFALVQPGQTPRYRAVSPGAVVGRRRAEVGEELDAAEAELTTIAAARGESREPVWVLRGRALVLEAAVEMVAGAEQRLVVRSPAAFRHALSGALAAARARGVAVDATEAAALLVVRDQAEALVGEVDGLTTHIRQPAVAMLLAATPAVDRTSWLAWEESKVRRLLDSVPALATLER